MRREDLEPWEQRLWTLVFARHPELEPHLGVAEHQGRLTATLNAPCPGAEDTGPLWISVEPLGDDACEATIGFHDWHGHYGLGPRDLSDLADPHHWFWMELSGILEERRVLYYAMDERGYLGGSIIPVEDALADDPGTPWVPRRGRCGIRSWRGTHDRDDAGPAGLR